MPKQRILIVDDEEDILELVKFNFEREGYKVNCVATGEEALKHAELLKPHLIILDLMLPGIDGLEVARKLREKPETKAIPIVMLTAKGEEADMVTGLEIGADDYVTKPFSPRVLLARVRAVLRRKEFTDNPGQLDPIVIEGLCIHPGRREVTIDGRSVNLTFSEFEILKSLASRPGWVFTRYQIVDMVHGQDYAVTERSVDVQVAGLRKKLGPYARYIETVRGVGYRFKE